MPDKGLRVVLITSGIDHLSARFHSLPENPVGIIELGEWDTSQRFKYAVRKALRVFKPGQYPDCELYCRKHGLAYHRIAKQEKSRIAEVIKSLDANLVFTYRCPLIPVVHLAGLSHGAINLHNSLLPDYRGGNPLFWQVLNGEEQMGCTVHRLTDQMDGGDILRQIQFARPKNVHHKDLNYLANVEKGFPLVCSVVESIAAGADRAEPQPEIPEINSAPNCDWSTWRELEQAKGLSDERLHDMACFVGEAAQPTIENLKRL